MVHRNHDERPAPRKECRGHRVPVERLESQDWARPAVSSSSDRAHVRRGSGCHSEAGTSRMDARERARTSVAGIGLAKGGGAGCIGVLSRGGEGVREGWWGSVAVERRVSAGRLMASAKPVMRRSARQRCAHSGHSNARSMSRKQCSRRPRRGSPLAKRLPSRGQWSPKAEISPRPDMGVAREAGGWRGAA